MPLTRFLPVPAALLAFAERIRPPVRASLRVRKRYLDQRFSEEFQTFAQPLQPDCFLGVAAYWGCGPGYLCTERTFEEGGYEPTAANVGGGLEARLKEAIRKPLR